MIPTLSASWPSHSIARAIFCRFNSETVITCAERSPRTLSVTLMTAHDLAPDDCSTSQRPEPPSLISRRCGPGLRFSIVFAVSFRVMCYPASWRVTKSPVLPCYPVLHHTAEQPIFVKQIRGPGAPVCSALLPVRRDDETQGALGDTERRQSDRTAGLPRPSSAIAWAKPT